MSFDESFWVAFSIVAFAILVFKHIKNPIFIMLDSKSATIKGRIHEAELLKQEAEHTLEEVNRLSKLAIDETKKMLADTEKEVEFLKQSAMKNLQEKIESKRKVFENKIKVAESLALEKLRKEAVNIAVTSAIKLLKENNEFDKVNLKLIDNSIKHLGIN